MKLEDFDYWLANVRVAMLAASVIRQVHDHMDRGLGLPDTATMRRFNSQADEIVKLWETSFEEISR